MFLKDIEICSLREKLLETSFVFCAKLHPDLNGALFVRRYDEQKSGSGRRKRYQKKKKKIAFDECQNGAQIKMKNINASYILS